MGKIALKGQASLGLLWLVSAGRGLYLYNRQQNDVINGYIWQWLNDNKICLLIDAH